MYFNLIGCIIFPFPKKWVITESTSSYLNGFRTIFLAWDLIRWSGEKWGVLCFIYFKISLFIVFRWMLIILLPSASHPAITCSLPIWIFSQRLSKCTKASTVLWKFEYFRNWFPCKENVFFIWQPPSSPLPLHYKVHKYCVHYVKCFAKDFSSIQNFPFPPST